MKIAGRYRKEAGMVAWVINIISGFAIGSYCIINALVIFELTRGEHHFDAIMKMMFSPFVLVIEMLLFIAVLYHIFNGIRVLLFDFGLWIEDQKDIFYVVVIAIMIIFAVHFLPLIEEYIR
jgi:succinate dehydrogenase / fumarate reductase cytochrome b subunit